VRGTLSREKLHDDEGTMSKENIIGKIRKLLAIADKNSGASANEMMTAMSMAQALMLRHHLSPRSVPGFRNGMR
jgi:hypothetical protein